MSVGSPAAEDHPRSLDVGPRKRRSSGRSKAHTNTGRLCSAGSGGQPVPRRPRSYALGTQNERYFVAVHPTAHSLACLRIGVFVTADAARLATGVGRSPFTGRVSHPLDGEQSFMTSPHRHSPLTSLAWSHRAPTPPLEALVGFSRWGFRLLGDLFFSYQSSILIPGSWTTTWSVQILVLPELRIVDHRLIPRAIL